MGTGGLASAVKGKESLGYMAYKQLTEEETETLVMIRSIMRG